MNKKLDRSGGKLFSKGQAATSPPDQFWRYPTQIKQRKEPKMPDDIPISVKAHLLELAKRVPEAGRSTFIRGTATRLQSLALRHENTLVYGAIGWVVGELLDNYLTMSIPLTDIAVCLTGDHASTLIGIGGALFGLYQDTQQNEIRRQVAEIVGSELRSALAMVKT